MKRRIMIILFILTLCSLYFALGSMNLVGQLNPQPGFRFVKNSWVFWCWLPIPVISIILGFKYQKNGLKCKKNIIGGFVIAFLLLAYGSFSILHDFGRDYSQIDPYRSVIGAALPEHGDLEIQEWGTFFDADKTEYVVIDAYYGGENVEDMEQSITNSDNWIPCTSFRTELKALMPSQFSFRSDPDAYYSVYNKTTGEYNTLPTGTGVYEIYSMRYDCSDKQLEIHRYLMQYVK